MGRADPIAEPGGGPHGAVTLVRVKWMLGQQKTPPSSQAVLDISLAERRDKWYQWWVPREERPWRLRVLSRHHHMYKLKSLSCVWLFETPWTVANLSMGFPRQEYWNGLPLPSPGDFPDPGIKPRSPALQADALPVRCDTQIPRLKFPLGKRKEEKKGTRNWGLNLKGHRF